MATYSVIAHDGKMYGPADEMALEALDAADADDTY